MVDINNLPSEKVRKNLEIYKQLLRENFPNIGIDRGLLHDHILYFAALFATIHEQQYEELKNGFNLNNVINNPESIPDDIIDSLAKNWLLCRHNGSQARGAITIILPKKSMLILPKGVSFKLDDVTFYTPEVYTVRIESGAQLAKNDRLLTKTMFDKYAANIPIVCSQIGEAGNIDKDTYLELTSSNLPIINAYSATVFEGGTNRESNTELVKRILTIISGRN